MKKTMSQLMQKYDQSKWESALWRHKHNQEVITSLENQLERYKAHQAQLEAEYPPLKKPL
jgi:arginyl-tRNA synthetase